jgi:uncharacterized integral membrane protein (TIGR00697 family)
MREGTGGTLAVPQVALAALFVTALMAAQVTASKVVAIGLPFSLPLTGSLVLVPGAVFAYALTFFASDCYAELYGKRAAQALVNVAFAMNLVLLVLVWLAIAAPVFQGSPVGQDAFRNVLGASTGVVVGSLAAYVVSQNWDVVVFHRLREYTDGDRLWLRNVGSTATSQLIDTVIFITIAFYLFQGLALGQVLGLVVGQYLEKLLIAVVDTPFVYAVVGFVRGQEKDGPTTAD